MSSAADVRTARSFGEISLRLPFSLPEMFFLLSVFLAPIELRLVGAVTVHDLLIGFLFLAIVVGSGGRLPHLPSVFLPPAYFFLLCALVSTFRSTYPLESLTQILEFAFVFFVHLPVVLALTRSRRMVQSSAAVFLAASLVVVFSAMVFWHVQGAGRALVFFSHNPNRLGYPSGFVMPFALAFALLGWRRRRRLLVVALAVPAFYTLLWALGASGSRSSLVATLASMSVFLAFRRGLAVDLKVPLRILAAAVVTLGIGYALYASHSLPQKLHQRIDRTFANDTTMVDDRLYLDLAGFRAFQASPLVGVGLDNFQYVAKQYEPLATNQAPHNLWLQLLAQVGLPGTLMFAALMGLWGLTLVRACRGAGDADTRELLWAFVSSMLGILTIFMFIPMMNQRQYWLVWGLGLAAALVAEEAARGPWARAVAARPRPRPLGLPSSTIAVESLPGIVGPARLRVLHLILRAGPTNGQYNDHCLPMVERREISICTYFPTPTTVPDGMRLFDGDGSLRGFFRALKAALTSQEYDVIHAHSPQAGVLLILGSALLGRLRRVRRISVYSLLNEYRNYKARNRFLLHFTFPFFRRVVLCGHAVLESLPAFLRWSAARRMRVVPNGVDIDRVDKALQAEPWRPSTRGAFTAAWAGRLVPIKNTAALLTAFEALGSNGPSRLVIVGDGILRAQTESLIREKGLQGKVTLTGLVGRDEVFSYLARAHLFVSPSRGEGLPVAVIEAMACGLPVVLSDIQPHREIAEGADFIPLLDPDDVRGLTREIERFRRMPKAEREEIGRRCRKLVEERFSTTTMHERIEAVYAELGARRW